MGVAAPQAPPLPGHHFIPITDPADAEPFKHFTGVFKQMHVSVLLPVVIVLHTAMSVMCERVQFSPQTARQTTLSFLTLLYLVAPLSIAFCCQPGLLMRRLSKQVVRAKNNLTSFEQQQRSHQNDATLFKFKPAGHQPQSSLGAVLRSNHVPMSEVKEQQGLSEEWLRKMEADCKQAQVESDSTIETETQNSDTMKAPKPDTASPPQEETEVSEES